MSTGIRDQLNADIKTAMKAGDKPRLGALRLISAAFKQHEVDKREEIDDKLAIDIMTRMSKQRRESISQYQDAGRDDLVHKEEFELALITEYLPAQLDADAIGEAVDAAISQTGAASMKDMGKVMGALNASLKGRADMSAVSAAVKSKLAGG